jgi:hypothetical protein
MPSCTTPQWRHPQFDRLLWIGHVSNHANRAAAALTDLVHGRTSQLAHSPLVLTINNDGPFHAYRISGRTSATVMRRERAAS